MKKTKNKWRTESCPLCLEKHGGYSGKLDSNGREYVICGQMQKKCMVGTNDNWIKEKINVE